MTVAATHPARPIQAVTPKRMTCRLANLTINQDLQWRRRGLNQDRVTAYMQDIEGWLANNQPIGFPALEVWEIEGTPHVVSGFHRYAALKAIGIEEFTCYVYQGSWVEAKRASALSNLQHGLEYDELSKKAIMTFMMQPGGDWERLSNGAIASLLHIGSPTTIAMWIDQLSKTGELNSDRSCVQGRDGKWRDVTAQKAKFTPEQIAHKREQYKLRQAVKAGWIDEAHKGEWTEASEKPNDTRLIHRHTGEVVGGVRSDGGVLATPNQPVFEKPSREVIAKLALDEQADAPSTALIVRQVEFTQQINFMEVAGKNGLKYVDTFRLKWSDVDTAFLLNYMGQKLAEIYGAWFDMAETCQLEVNEWEVRMPE